MQLTLRAAGPVSADEAWDRYARPERWRVWAPQIRRVQASAERIAAGVTGRVYGPAGLSVGFVVDAVDEADRTWSWTVRLGPITLRLDHGVTARAGGSATWLTVHGPPPVVLGYAPVARLALHQLVSRR